MISLLAKIWCVIAHIDCYIVYALKGALNAVIYALGAVCVAALALLPNFPAFSGLPSQFSSVVGWIAWVFPVGTLADIVAFYLLMWLAWQVVVILLRWAKAAE